jgi:hypothetical protein
MISFKERICQHLQPLFDRFHINHHRFYLRRRSRLPFAYTNHHAPESTATLDQLIPLSTSVGFVQKFLRVWLTSVLPVDLFGSKSNRQQFIRHMCMMIELPRTQEYTLSDAIRGLKCKQFHWSNIDCQRSSLVRQLYICHVIYFVIQYVLTLVRSFFYVTEASAPSHPLVLVYYRHKIWYRSLTMCYLKINIYSSIHVRTF